MKLNTRKYKFLFIPSLKYINNVVFLKQKSKMSSRRIHKYNTFDSTFMFMILISILVLNFFLNDTELKLLLIFKVVEAILFYFCFCRVSLSLS